MITHVCICDYWHGRHYWQITGNNQLLPRNNLDEYKNRKLRRLKIVIDAISLFYLKRELEQFTQYRLALKQNLERLQVELLWLRIVPPPKEILDYKWNQMLAHTLWEKIEVENMMSWLSTLGGGFSALGEQFTTCAEIAGKISLKQLSIGIRLGDPFLESRCKLFYAISLIQTGRLRMAKHIIRQQYKFAVKVQEYDGRLIKMCLGIWMRLQYEYRLRLQKKQVKAKGSKELSVVK